MGNEAKITKNGNLNKAGVNELAKKLGVNPDQLLAIANGDTGALSEVVSKAVSNGVKPKKALNTVEYGWTTRDEKTCFTVTVQFRRRTVKYIWDGNEAGPFYVVIKGKKLRQNARYSWAQIRSNALKIVIEAVEQLGLTNEVESKLGIDIGSILATEEAEAQAEDDDQDL